MLYCVCKCNFMSLLVLICGHLRLVLTPSVLLSLLYPWGGYQRERELELLLVWVSDSGGGEGVVSYL